jgi:FecR protein
MLSSRSLMSRVILLVPVLLSLSLGMAACGTKVAAFTPLTVLSIVGGNVLIQKPSSTNWNAGKEGTTLETGDKIKTDDGATATVTFFDGSTIQLNSDTEISLDELLSKSSNSSKTIKIGQTIGETSSSIVKLVDPASRYEVDTQAGVAAVGGSKMVVTVATDGATGVYNVEGIISFTAQGQEVMIPVGSVSTAKPGEVPSTPQPGTPPEINATNVTSISSQIGWQQTGLYLNAGDKFYVDYSGGSWTVDYKNSPYVGPAGYSPDIDKTIAPGYKFDSSVPYGYLLGEVGNGKEILIGGKGGPFTPDVSGFLSLRINDSDSTSGDNDGAITINLRGPSTNLKSSTTSTLPHVSSAGTQGWISEKSPNPNGNLFGVWGSSSSDVFAVDEAGPILHYDGKVWSTLNSPNQNIGFLSIWGSSSTDIFAVGEAGNIIHYNGQAWSTMNSPTTNDLYSVWGSSSSDVFAVGDFGTIIHYDGRMWSNININEVMEFFGVWGSSSSDVFVVGQAGTVLHYDGSTWSTMNSSTSNELAGIWGSSSSDVFAVGKYGTILHYDGRTWSAMNTSTTESFTDVWGSSSSNVFAVGNVGNENISHYDGNSWSALNNGTTDGFRGIWGSSSSDVFTVGAGAILHYSP